MILIVGGAGQGKLAYALERTGLGPEDVGYTPAQAQGKAIFCGLETWMRDHVDEDLHTLLAQNPNVIILCNEVGCGVVPMDKEERAWREAVGRLCCKLARRAERVERIFCGLATVLKGEGTWS